MTDNLREAVQKIIDGDYDRPVANTWRGDGLPSKHDTCPHSEPMWEDCPACMEQALRAALAAAPQPAPDREALVALIREARMAWANDGDGESCPDAASADALLAAGWRKVE